MRDKVTRTFVVLRYILRGEPRYVVGHSLEILLTGVLALGMVRLFHAPMVISGMFAMSLGAAGASLREWRTERGLWMLAMVFLVLFGATWLMFVTGRIMDMQRGAQASSIGLAVDFAMGSILLFSLVRFLARVARENFAISAEQP